MKLWQIVALLLATLRMAYADSASTVKPEPVVFKRGNLTLHGCVYRPEGSGMFPAIIFNQSATKPSYEKIDWPPFSSLAQFFTSHGYVFFLPGRYSYDDIYETPAAASKKGASKWELESDSHNADVLAALEWLKGQSYVDDERVIVAGHSAGAVQSVLVAAGKPGIRGTIAFSLGAVSWKGSTRLQRTLETAIRAADRPIFLLQPQNDYSTDPSRVLGDILKEKGPPNRAKVFPAFGDTKAEANLFGINGSSIWGEEVLEFLKVVMK